MLIKKQQLLFSLGGLVRVYRSFDPVIFYVVSPFEPPASFSSFSRASNYAYNLFCDFIDERDDD